jgi:hypothetical protein
VEHRFKNRFRGYTVMDDIRLALSSKPVIIILSISLAIRIFFQFQLLPNSASVFGPDERTYALLAKYVSQGLPVAEYPAYGPHLYNSSKSIILPSAFLIKLGLEELTAVRTMASVYGLTSTILLALSFIAYLRLRNQNIQELSSYMDKKFEFILVFFSFLPSNFIWSTLGLRESGSQFWLIMTFYLILKLLNSSGRDLWKFTALAAFALTFAYGTRPQTALVFSFVGLIFSLAVLLKFRKLMPLVAFSIGIFAGHAFTTTPTTPTTPTTINTLNALQNQVLKVKVLQSIRNANTVGAQSALPISTCQSSSSEIFYLIKCSLSELPYRLFAFFFRPLIFFDQGSKTLNLAALENLGWMILVPLSVWVSLRRKENSLDRFINLSLTAYILLFASAAALYEGNLGTAFRHKSTILWPLVFILMLAPGILPKFKGKTKSFS